ncbi:oxoglutarate/iron-dependent dioxygenase [Artemisia annua]|nr:oxoglutarate/iron-dependent dioxygenase [Artemisia annua]
MHKLPSIDFTNKKNLKPSSTSWLATALEATRALEEYGCFIAEFDKVTPELNDAVFHGLEDLFDIPIETKVLNKSTKPFENVLAYNKLVAELEEMVTRMVFETYGVEKYLDAHRKMVTYLCRGMKYRPPVENETNMGFVPHTDKDFITVLHQNGVNGLEVKARDGEWFSVELVPSSYIVMSGDAAMAWSNERLYSPFHRVTMNGKESRYSIAQFSFLEGIIETPKEFVDEEHPLLYKPFDHLKYLDFYNKEENRRLECAIRTYCGV